MIKKYCFLSLILLSVSCQNLSPRDNGASCKHSSHDTEINTTRKSDKFSGLVFYAWGNFQDRSVFRMDETLHEYTKQIQYYDGSVSSSLSPDIDFILIGYPIDELLWTEAGMPISTISNSQIDSYEEKYDQIVSWALENDVMLVDEDLMQRWLYGSSKMAHTIAGARGNREKKDAPTKNSDGEE